MKAMKHVLGLVAIVGLLGFALTFIIEVSFRSRARRVQLVHLDRIHGNLFGPAIVEEGEPIELIPTESTPFLKNKTSVGLATVDADLLKKKPDGGFKMDDIQPLITLARFGSAIASLICFLGWAFWPTIDGTVIELEP